jgi:hypothetical protein
LANKNKRLFRLFNGYIQDMALNHTKRMGMEKHIPPLEKGDEGGFFE